MIRFTPLFCLLVSVLCGFNSIAYAGPSNQRITPPYSMEEIYERARALKKVLSKDFPEDSVALLDLSIKAAEFSGYVAGTIDQQEFDEHRLVECSHRNTLTVIAGRTAAVLTSIPLDRSKPAGLAVLLAIHYACDDLKQKSR